MNTVHNLLKNIQLSTIKKLTSGTKLITMNRLSPINCLGVFIKAGSRYTKDFPQGITQVIKRTALKGTQSKKSEFELMSFVDSLGGEMVCDFQRDVSIYFSKFYSNDYEKIFSTLTESIFQPIITDEEVQLQKKMILNELEYREYNSELDNKFFDYIMDSCYQNNTIGLRETPSVESLNQITKETIYEYLSIYYRPERMSIVGVNIPHDALLELSEKSFGGEIHKIWGDDISLKTPDNSVACYTGGYSCLHDSAPRKQPGHVVLPELAYVSVGFEGCKESSDDIYSFAVLFSLIGQGKSFSVGGPGKGMYNRVNLNVLNKYYWVNSVEAFVQSFEDTGFFTIYGTCQPENVSNFVNVILSEYYKILNDPIDQVEFDRAKRQLLSQLTMNLEISNMALEDLGRQSLFGDHYKCWPELFAKVEQVTIKDIKDSCAKMLKSNPSIAAMGNLNKIPKFEHIQEAVSKLKLVQTPSRWFL